MGVRSQGEGERGDFSAGVQTSGMIRGGRTGTDRCYIDDRCTVDTRRVLLTAQTLVAQYTDSNAMQMDPRAQCLGHTLYQTTAGRRVADQTTSSPCRAVKRFPVPHPPSMSSRLRPQH